MAGDNDSAHERIPVEFLQDGIVPDLLFPDLLPGECAEVGIDEDQGQRTEPHHITGFPGEREPGAEVSDSLISEQHVFMIARYRKERDFPVRQ